jgi:hypothetical protein
MKDALAVIKDTILCVVCFPMLPLVCVILEGVQVDNENNTINIDTNTTITLVIYGLAYWMSLIGAITLILSVLL